MADKFIPNGDVRFRDMATSFARAVAADPERVGLTRGDADEIATAVGAFQTALMLALQPSTRTQITAMERDAARAAAERVIRRHANVVRANPRVSAADKLALGLRVRSSRPTRRACPQTPPVLRFVGIGSLPATPMSRRDPLASHAHVLHFCEELGSGTSARPAGAARVELFVEQVREDEPIPRHPGELSGGRPWYIGSFTRNPMRVAFPVPPSPRLIVYWARWAGATGDTGPYSTTCIARVEGWAMSAALEDGRAAQRRLPDQAEPAERCVVTLTETHQRRLEQSGHPRLLPEAATIDDAVRVSGGNPGASSTSCPGAILARPEAA